MLVVGSDPEFHAFSKVLIKRAALGTIMDSDIEHVNTPLILAVISPNVRLFLSSFDNNSNAVQLCVSGMEDVTGHRSDGRTEEAIECGRELCGDRLRRATFDLVPVDKVHDLAVAQQRHGRTTRLIFTEVLARARRRIDILPGKHGDNLLGHNPVLQSEGKCRTSIASGTTTDRVDEDQH
jgi:hypothetical protein